MLKKIKKQTAGLAANLSRSLHKISTAIYKSTTSKRGSESDSSHFAFLEEIRFSSVSNFIRHIDMHVSAAATGAENFIDVNEKEISFIYNFLEKIIKETEERIYILSSDGIWIDPFQTKIKRWMLKPGKSGFIELAVTGRSGHLTDRFSLNPWRNINGLWEALSPVAPVKKLISEAHFKEKFLGPRADSNIGYIDIVYTWVNSDDKSWQNMIAPYNKDGQIDSDRYLQSDELKFSLRSLFTFAPWVRNIYIFTNCAPPDWFQDSGRVKWIMHEQVIPEQYLPLFNSHAIETFLHEIPGLSERYIYFNDDVFLSAPLAPSDFFSSYGQSISRLEANGVIHYLIDRTSLQDDAEEWQFAAINCAKLLQKATGILPTKLHCHTPHAYIRSTYLEMTRTFPTELEITRNARFRMRTDYSFSSFLYHHFALASGKAIPHVERSMIVRATNYQRFLSKRIYRYQRFFCINDGGGSAEHEGFSNFKKTFLQEHYPFKSPAEV